MKGERHGCGAGSSIAVWSISDKKLLIAKRVRNASQLVLLLHALVRLHGFPDFIECDRGEIVGLALQDWVMRSGIRVDIGPVSSPELKALIETLRHEHDQRRLLEIPGSRVGSSRAQIVE